MSTPVFTLHSAEILRELMLFLEMLHHLLFWYKVSNDIYASEHVLTNAEVCIVNFFHFRRVPTPANLFIEYREKNWILAKDHYFIEDHEFHL